jgi:hypothetical protein
VKKKRCISRMRIERGDNESSAERRLQNRNLAEAAGAGAIERR